MGKTDAPSGALKALVLCLAVFCAATWFAAAPWEGFIRETTKPLVPSPEPTPEPPLRVIVDAPSPEPPIGGPVPAGFLAVRGRAVDQAGEAFERARVTVRVVSLKKPRSPEEQVKLAAPSERLSLEERLELARELAWGAASAPIGSAQSLSDGRFEVIVTAPREVQVLAIDVRSFSKGVLVAFAREVHASSDDARDGALLIGRVTLRSVSPVTLLVSDGATPLAGARLKIELDQSPLLPLALVTGPDGIAELALPAGDHVLVAARSGYLTKRAPLPVVGGAPAFTIELVPAPK